MGRGTVLITVVEYEVAESRNCNQDARSLVCIAGGGWQNETVMQCDTQYKISWSLGPLWPDTH